VSEPPSALLLRVRESDVVRMCGLAGAARGLDLASRRAVTGCRRMGSRLGAAIQVAADEETSTWAELRDDGPSIGLLWGCSCAVGQAHLATQTVERPPALACEHVAALLTAWVRHPGDFATPATSPPPATRRMPAAGSPAARPIQAGAHPAAADTRSAPDDTRSGARLALREELQRLPDQELAALARRVLGDEPTPEATRQAIVGKLGVALADPEQLAPLLRRLDPAATELLRAVVLLGGAITVAELDGIGRRSAAGRMSAEAAAGILRRHGLLFMTPGHASTPGPRQDRAWRQLAGWHVPAEVRAALGRALPIAPLRADLSREMPELPPIGAHTPQPVEQVRPAPLRQLCATLALLVHSPSPMRPGSPGSPGAVAPAARRTGQGHAALLPPVPGDPPAAVVAAWARGARVPVGMALMARRVLLLALDAEGDGHPLRALDRLPAVEWPLALRAGFRLWLAAESHAELADLTVAQHRVGARCDPGHPGLRPATLAAETASARRFVVELVRYAAGGAWFALDDLVDLVWRLDPFFLRGRQRAFDVPAWWLEGEQVGRPLRADVKEEWQQADGRFLLALLVGPLHWWGVVDLALDAAGTARAIRVTALGAYLLGITASAPDVAGSLAGGWGAAVELSRGGAVAIHPLAAGAGLLDTLAPWAQASGVMGGRLVVQLSPDLACRSLDAGLEPAGALARLQALDARDGTRAAPVVERALTAWRGRYGATRIESGWALLEADDAPVLQEALRAVPGVADRCRVVAPTSALVPAAELEVLRGTLNRRGFVV
jgi:hypothetical protein